MCATPPPATARLIVVALFLNEVALLPTALGSIAAQTRRPDQLLLVDDGSTDGSHQIALEFASQHPWAVVLRRPARPLETDRLATAAELRAFQWGVEHARGDWDVIAKLDTDLDLAPEHFATVMNAFAADPELGVAGVFLSLRRPDGTHALEVHPASHVRGPNKFYRAACFHEIQPVPPILGWDEIDDVKARMRGWSTRSFQLSGRPSIHLRPTGAHDGRLRGFRRWGECYWGLGMSPPGIVALAIVRLKRRPHVLASVNLLWGYSYAAVRRRPRADRAVRHFRRQEQRRRARDAVVSVVRGHSTRPQGLDR